MYSYLLYLSTYLQKVSYFCVVLPFWRMNMNQTKPHQNKKMLAKKLKRVRTHIAKMTQNEFAESLGISRIYVTQLENPDSPKYPSTDLIRRISDLYHIDYNYLSNTQEPLLKLEYDMEIILQKMTEEDLFTSESENASPYLQIFARNYYRLIEDKLIDGISPENMEQKTYENYALAFYSLFEILCQTMQAMQQKLKVSDSISSDLFETYLQAVQNQESLFIREETNQK